MKRYLLILTSVFAVLLAFAPVTGFGTFFTVDFEDDLQVGSNIICNPDILPFECNPSHHEWLKSKGIDITGTPNGFVWATKIGGPIGATGVVIGFASPDYLETDEGLSDNEVLTVHFLDSLVNFVEIELTVLPSDVSLINNVPATVVMNAFDSGSNLLATATKTFTGVTNSVHTPTEMSISTSGIARITLEVTQHPYGGVWLESITFNKQTVAVEVPVDIKPQSCPNPLNVGDRGVLPITILGTADFDVTMIDPASIRLLGVSPLRSSVEDVANPFKPFVGREMASDCTTGGPDGYADLTLKFHNQAVVSALGTVTYGEVLVLQLTGNLFDDTPIVGEDVVVILKKK